MTVRKRAVARGVGVNLGAIQTHGAKLEQFHLGGHLQHLHKQVGEIVNEPPAIGGQGVVIGVSAGCNVAKGRGVVGGHLQLAAGVDARQ